MFLLLLPPLAYALVYSESIWSWLLQYPDVVSSVWFIAGVGLGFSYAYSCVWALLEYNNLLGNEKIQRLDIPSKVNGTAQFGIDVVLPGMKYATVKTSPVFGGAVEAFDAARAEKMKGYKR